MKQFYLSLLVSLAIGTLNAQIISFSDTNFKNKLLAATASNFIAKDLAGNFFKVDANNDHQIDVAEALNVSYLDIHSSSIANINGIQYFTNLISLQFGVNQITAFDLSALVNLKLLNTGGNPIAGGVLNFAGLTALEELYCVSNSLTSLNLTGLPNLKKVECESNSNLASLVVSGLTHLEYLRCDNTKITSLDVSGLTSLTYLGCGDNHQLASLNVAGAVNLETLQCSTDVLTVLDLSGLSHLIELDCSHNQLTNLAIDQLTMLEDVRCEYNQLATLNIGSLVHLRTLDCGHNQISSLVTTAADFQYFWCEFNQITALDFSNSHLVTLNCSFNQLASLLVKCGPYISTLSFDYNPNLQYVCADEEMLEYIESFKQSASQVGDFEYNSYCSLVPGGDYYTVAGNQKWDMNGDGCDATDPTIPRFYINQYDGANNLVGSNISDASGNYSSVMRDGAYSLVPKFENPGYFNVSPPSVNVDFPDTASPVNQNFCITANGLHPDLEVSVLPILAARPGFDASYKIIYKNKGTNTQSGTVNLNFNDAVLDMITANPAISAQSVNNMSWNFTNLIPFETRQIIVTVNVNSPIESPPVSGGFVLNYTATVNSANVDETLADNSFSYAQTVVNSFDPNDKTCLEGATITPAMVGKEVHYMIRFENTGTANAENIVVKDMIDTAKFDINSLIPLDGSAPFVTCISNTNKVEFIFENINLPFDDANNDGYVTFKIKTKPTLVLGDTFSNTASIYFDYNFPIVTNTATTTIAVLAKQDFDFENYFRIYPNPANNVLNIESKKQIEVSSINIYNTLGQLVLVVPNAKDIKAVDVSALKSGNYFVKILSDKGSSNMKFIKQ
jgi:hypothetical protein